ncbi:hypothetical protein V1477_013918 [Vespula maculifrons]|uniref:Uncharacterized protein n=1 Tax=Vespula maculifrons TaxID=7453 RepID=A0ABD2BPN3_VESMC
MSTNPRKPIPHYQHAIFHVSAASGSNKCDFIGHFRQYCSTHSRQTPTYNFFSNHHDVLGSEPIELKTRRIDPSGINYTDCINQEMDFNDKFALDRSPYSEILRNRKIPA